MVNFGAVAATRRPYRPLRGYRNVLFGNKVDLDFTLSLCHPARARIPVAFSIIFGWPQA